ncbi:MAG: SDR family NAD(P)-dependent oxidoreductase [Propionibacteriales bacterium]|nr:SDR family NAD(P)-dependent oxidoreductase [Propionibacteriales bacterium]
MDITDRLAIVTGAASGLGEVIATHLAGAGARVLLVDTDRDLAEQARERVAAHGPDCAVVVADLVRAEDRAAAVARAVELGGPHVLINNAGGWGLTQFPDAAPEQWQQALELNLVAPMDLTQRCLTPMRELGGGAVVSIASSAGRETGPYGSPEYGAAKAGLIRFTTAVAGTAGDRSVRVSCVVPNWIGLPRALEEFAALPQEVRAVTPAPIRPAVVADAVIACVTDDTASGRVVVLEGAPPGSMAAE